MSTHPASVVTIAWYLPEQYDRIIQVMADGGSFPRTHASWRQKAVRMERELKRKGMKPVRVEIHPEEFQRWCARAGRAPDSGARRQFVEETLAGPAPGTA